MAWPPSGKGGRPRQGLMASSVKADVHVHAEASNINRSSSKEGRPRPWINRKLWWRFFCALRHLVRATSEVKGVFMMGHHHGDVRGDGVSGPQPAPVAAA